MTKQTFTTGQVLTAAQMTSLQQTAMGGGSTTAKVASYTLVAADAGTVVQMNAAGATTITVNQNLFSAGDTVQIQNIGAGVCTVTAGSASVNTAGSLALSQYEGGQLYFNTASAAFFFDIVQSSGMANPLTTTGDIIYSSSGTTAARLGIGTTGQNLVVASGIPSWATPSAGAMTLIQRSTFSNVADTSTTFDSVFTTTYATYSIVIENCFASTNADNLEFQFRYAGPTTQATTNIWSNYTTTIYNGAQAMSFGNNTANIELAQDTGSSAERSTGQYWINDYQTSAVVAFFGSTIVRNAVSGVEVYAYQYTARTYTGFILSSSSSNISGTVAIYGLAK